MTTTPPTTPPYPHHTPSPPPATTGNFRFLAAVRFWLALTASLLVATIAVLAFAVSFEAISAYAVEIGAFPPSLRWCAPLLVDTFTAAGAITSLWLSLTIPGAARTADAWYARTLIAIGTAASLAINIAHAPDGWAPRLVAGIPPLALLLAVELLLSLARRTLDAHLEHTTHHPPPHRVHDPAPGAQAHTGRTQPSTPAAPSQVVHERRPHTPAGPPHDTPRTPAPSTAPTSPALPAPATARPARRPAAHSLRARVEAIVIEREAHGHAHITPADLAAELNANLGTVRNALRAARRAHGLNPPSTRRTPDHPPPPHEL